MRSIYSALFTVCLWMIVPVVLVESQQVVLAQTTDERKQEADRLLSLGVQQFNQGETSLALETFQQELAIRQAINDRANQWRSWGWIGLVYSRLGLYEQALESHKQALALTRELGDRSGEGTTLNNIGLVYHSLGQYSQALEQFQQALAIRREIGDRSGEGTTLNNIGAVYDSLGQYPQALEQFQQALAIRREIGDRSGEGSTLNNIGAVYHALGQYPQALEHYQQALAIRREIGDRSGEGYTLNNIGYVLEAQKQNEMAIVFLKQSVNIFERIRGDLKSLSSEQQKSYTDTIASVYRKLADLLITKGRFAEAWQVLELLKVQEIQDYTRGRVEDRVGEPLPTSATETALQQASEANINSRIALGRKIEACEDSIKAGQPECSENEIIQLQQERQKLSDQWWEIVREFEPKLIAEYDQDTEAIHVDRLIRDSEDIVRTPNTVLIYPVVLEDKLQLLWITNGKVANAITVPEATAEKINAAVGQFIASMKSCELGGCTAAHVAGFQAVSQQLYDWMMPPELEAELQQNQIENLVFALDRSLRYFPMAALFDGERYLIEKYTVSNVTGASITEWSSIRLTPDRTSVMALGLSDAVPELGFRYPLDKVPFELDAIVQRQDTPDPTGIYRGVEHLNDQFTEAMFDQLLGQQILHIATHGVFVPTSYDASYLVLGNKQQWPITRIEEVAGKFAHLSMVVLSACETAVGNTQQNELGRELPDGREISSIAQAFIDAGVDTVVASLWQVNDRSTGELMQQFYANLAAQPDMTIAKAMQQAQIQMLRGTAQAAQTTARGSATVNVEPKAGTIASTYTHPYYWSPFIIIGNGL